MSTAPTSETGHHAFAAALPARDVDALVEALAPHPVLHSAVTGVPFEGREVLADLYRSLFESFEELRIMDELEAGDTRVFFWEGRIDGRSVAGADRLRLDREGKVEEITIVGRPLTGLSAFLTGIGYHFARRRRGTLAATLIRASARPLGPLFALVDPLTRWLVRGAGGSRSAGSGA